ncbi:DNA-processing protein DprA, partial [Bordetella pertussis]|uniref:DNA-processing protein DprA n=1 Tax=Bordetella pertussis TaxID=520 RepID=UPI000B18DCA2
AFARHLAGQGWCIVSGLALGIDAAAHEGALLAGEQGAGTVAVMGTGIDRIYPAAHRDLAHRIVQHGALVSELPLGTGSKPCRTSPTSWAARARPPRRGPPRRP